MSSQFIFQKFDDGGQAGGCSDQTGIGGGDTNGS
jgi:hypothetical protein